MCRLSHVRTPPHTAMKSAPSVLFGALLVVAPPSWPAEELDPAGQQATEASPSDNTEEMGPTVEEMAEREAAAAPVEPVWVEMPESEVREDLGREGDDVILPEEVEEAPPSEKPPEAPPEAAPEIPPERPAEEPVARPRPRTYLLDFYGSARVWGGDGGIRDNGSRVGLAAAKGIQENAEIFARVEAGLNIGSSIAEFLNPRDNPPEGQNGVVTRLSYLGLGTRFGALSFGKQWSVYYDVAGFTDRFPVFGAAALGVYNAGTDGGGTGTGRATNATKFRVRALPLTFGLQFQNNNEIPLSAGEQYDAAFGASLVYEWESGFSVGLAFNRADIDELTQELIDLGIDGNASAGVIGVSYREEPFFFSTAFARHKNQETTDEPLYIDGRGWEFYGRYQINRRFRVVGGFNYLKPDETDPNAGQYLIKYVLIGVQATFRDETYDQMAYLQIVIDEGRSFDGTKGDNILALGFRYGISI